MNGKTLPNNMINFHLFRKKSIKSTLLIMTMIIFRNLLNILHKPEIIKKWKNLLLFSGHIVIAISEMLIVLYYTGKHMSQIKSLYKTSKIKSQDPFNSYLTPPSKTIKNYSSSGKWDMQSEEVPSCWAEEPSWVCIILELYKHSSKLIVCLKS